MLSFTLLTHIPDILTIDYDRDYTMKIDRYDMLELTRRMSVARNCFSRIAGAYMDEDGFVDESFNTHFLKLTKSEQEKNIKIAKAIPTNPPTIPPPYLSQNILKFSICFAPFNFIPELLVLQVQYLLLLY